MKYINPKQKGTARKLSKRMEQLLSLAPEKWEATHLTVSYRNDTAWALADRRLIELRSHINRRTGHIETQWRKTP